MANAKRFDRPLVLRQSDFDPHLPPLEVIEALRQTFDGLAAGTVVQPPQSVGVFPHDQGDVITYSGILGPLGIFGAKLSPYLAARETGSKVTAWTALFSMETGEPILLCESLTLTAERTAATTALALRYLMASKARRLALIGTGPVGQAHYRFAQAIRDWDQVMVYSRRLAQSPSLLSRFPVFAKDQVIVAPSVQKAAENSDVVLLCTSAAAPVIDRAWLRPGQLVTSISTNAPGAHEISPASLPEMEVYCDYRATTPVVAGEMALAASQHLWSPDAIRADLPELVSGKGLLPSGRFPVFFRSVGLGIEDMTIAHALFARQCRPGSAGMPEQESAP